MDGRALKSDDLNYVPQFDDLNEFFTPREVLYYMSLLKVVDDPGSRRQAVFELLHILGLSNKADTSITSLSGGEKKRLSIGLGMVSEPAVLFLDEPTTGLASAAAYSVVGYISKLAAQTGVVCIMTIHQPAGEVFDMLEDLMLLERGRLAYFGTTQNARSFFDSLAGACPLAVNPADWRTPQVHWLRGMELAVLALFMGTMWDSTTLLAHTLMPFSPRYPYSS